MNLYLNCFLISLIGLGLSLLSVIYSLTTKAKKANVIFDWTLFAKADLVIQAIGTALTVALFLMLLPSFIEQYPKYGSNRFGVLLFFATIGYIGSDIASRFFSIVNKRINSAIDYKTDIADTQTGNLGTPTPALKPEPKP